MILATLSSLLLILGVQLILGAALFRAAAGLSGSASPRTPARRRRAAVLTRCWHVIRPSLPLACAAAAAGLQRLLLAREGLDAEEARIHETRENCRGRLVQTAGDIERETARASDAAEALARLDEESAALSRARAEALT